MIYDAKTYPLTNLTLDSTVSYGFSLFPLRFIDRASRLSHKWKGNEDREYEVSKIFGNDFSSRGAAANFDAGRKQNESIRKRR